MISKEERIEELEKSELEKNKEINQLECDLDDALGSNYQLEQNNSELIDEVANLKEQLNSRIDLENFIWQLKQQNMYDEKMQSFVDNYMRYYHE